MPQVGTVSLVVVVWPVLVVLWRQLVATVQHLAVLCGRYRRGWLLLLECILEVVAVVV